MANKLIQWNCRGLKANFNELLLLLTGLCPSIICLQETFLKPSDNLDIRGYTLYNHIHQAGDKASGGASIILNNSIPQSQIQLNTNLQAVAVKATVHKTIHVCSLYLPPSDRINIADLEHLIQQLPKPFIIMGDFNSHSNIWGCRDTDQKGRIIEDVINRNNLLLYNNKTYTYLHPGTGTYSAIDLTLADASIFLDYSWKVHNDTCGSDHFPIILENSGPELDDRIPRWNLRRAKWDEFKNSCLLKLNSDTNNTDDDNITYFSKTLISIAEESIPKTSSNKKYNKPWFDDDCKAAIRSRKAALRKFNLQPSAENLNNFKIHRAKTRRVIKISKKTTWRNYVSKLKSSSKSKKVWDMIRKISGKNTSGPIKHLSKNHVKATNKKDIADLLAKTFSNNSSSTHYSKQFQHIKKNAEKTKLNFKSNNLEDYNRPFSLSELTDCIMKSHNTAVGPDEIHYEFLKKLPSCSLDFLLQAFNEVWVSGKFPTSWKQATIIPIPKPGKDNTDPSNYRPIALTSCLCKTLERMINTRLIWFLESNGLITNFQCGFRSKRSTVDHLVRLETFVREAFIKKEHLTAVFFDLEKAYDTTWKYGIMRDLSDFGLKGRLPIFIDNFLSNRNFKVRVGTTLSGLQGQEEGVPQGSILSVTLFSIKINNIVKALNPGVDCSLYVDDFLICYRSKHIHTIERQLQQCLNKIQKWALENGFKFSKTKTQCMHFCQLRGLHNDPVLKLDGVEIPVVDQYKFLGIIFDRKLSFIPHINHLKAKCQKALQLLRVVAHTDWGADKLTLLKLYRSLVRSKLDYGCFIYGSARKSYLRCLDSIHHLGLRLALGALRTSPVESLYVEANEAPLSLRRERLALQYYTKLQSCPSNPAFECTIDPKYKELFARKESAIPSFGIRIQLILDVSNILNDNVHATVIPQVPPWTMHHPKVCLDLSVLAKKDTPSHVYIQKFNEIKDQYSYCIPIYTDGSKDNDRVGCGLIINNLSIKQRLPSNASIFTAEVTAIDLALDTIAESDDDHFIIFADSLSVLLSLHNKKMDNPLILQLLQKLHHLSCAHKTIHLCWIPSHIGIRGNEAADMAAKESLNQDITASQVPYTDLKSHINHFISSKWQERWSSCRDNKLFQIKPTLGEWPPGVRRSRKEEVVLSRLRIGHTYFSHSYILRREDPPECTACQEIYSVRHVLIDCIDLGLIRPRFYSVPDMKTLFDTVSVDRIISFVKEINLFSKI